MSRRSVIYMYMTGIRVLLSPTLREDVREEALSKVTFQKKSLPPTNEAFHLTVTELHRSVFLCWMTLVGLDMYACYSVAFILPMPAVPNSVLSLLTAVTAHAHLWHLR